MALCPVQEWKSEAPGGGENRSVRTEHWDDVGRAVTSCRPLPGRLQQMLMRWGRKGPREEAGL